MISTVPVQACQRAPGDLITVPGRHNQEIIIYIPYNYFKCTNTPAAMRFFYA